MVDKKGRTPLHLILEGMYPGGMYDLLLKSRVDIDATDHKGRTALHYVLAYRSRRYSISDVENWELITDYLKFNPSLSIQDHMGRTALDCALALGLSDIIDLLKANGAISTDTESYSDSEISWDYDEDDHKIYEGNDGHCPDAEDDDDDVYDFDREEEDDDSTDSEEYEDDLIDPEEVMELTHGRRSGLP
jgi:ankyrin repeat protein